MLEICDKGDVTTQFFQTMLSEYVRSKRKSNAVTRSIYTPNIHILTNVRIVDIAVASLMRIAPYTGAKLPLSASRLP